jgi:hypothetical protein
MDELMAPSDKSGKSMQHQGSEKKSARTVSFLFN